MYSAWLFIHAKSYYDLKLSHTTFVMLCSIGIVNSCSPWSQDRFCPKCTINSWTQVVNSWFWRLPPFLWRTK